MRIPEFIRRKDVLIGLAVGLGVIVVSLLIVWGLTRPRAATVTEDEITPSDTTAVGATFTPMVEETPVFSFTPAPTMTIGTAATAEPGTSTVTQMETYEVQAGDTLGGIAYEFGVSVDELRTANNLEGDLIRVGQELFIPQSGAAVTPPTATRSPATGTVIHEVAAGDTLGALALKYGVTVKEIQDTNDMDSDVIYVGQKLVIPGQETSPTATPAAGLTPTLTPVGLMRATPSVSMSLAASTSSLVSDEVWVPSVLEGNLATAYPAASRSDRFTLHYTPDTYPAQNVKDVVAMVERGLAHIEASLDASLEGTFDVYVAGSIFAAPDQALRGRSFSAQRRYFFLHDGSGNDVDQQYIATHELTHLISWNVFGRPSSVMLSEGVAVYTGMSLVTGMSPAHMPIETFCMAYHQAGKLPQVSSGLRYQGHIRDLENYYAAGCFVQYLIETYGPEKFGKLYPTEDYTGIYDKSLAALEQDWIEQLDAEVDFEPEDLITAVDAVADAYDELFVSFSGTPAEMAAYRELDAARIALLQGKLANVETHLMEFQSLLA
ncbi:MAG: LysM peptidoglycan-binding domain-containing protein [Anaerolineae bacterium]|nr:LysM peptidoglycan-binding domain-containing protein [Anaerolineae bacterium]